MVSRSSARKSAHGASPASLPPRAAETLNRALAVLDGQRRDRLLEAVAAAAKELLRSSDLAVSLPKVAGEIGSATGVDRTHIFLIDPKRREGRIVQHYRWMAPSHDTPPDIPDVTQISMVEDGLQPWIDRFRRGEPVVCHVRKLQAKARVRFEHAGIKSILSVPVFSAGEWSGMIGFDDCRSEHEWSAVEIDVIQTMAELVGAAVERTAHLQRLADANHIIENSPTILYRLRPQPPFPLVYLSENIDHYGYAAADLMAHPEKWPELIEPQDLPVINELIRSLLAGERAVAESEFRVKKADGSLAWLNGHGRLLHDAAGGVAAIEGILTDVTERKRAEAEQAFSRILLTTVIESSPDAILSVDACGSIIMYNRHFGELWNLPSELLQTAEDKAVLKAVADQIKDKTGFLARIKYLYEHPNIRSHEEIELLDGRVIDRHSGALYDPRHKYLGRVWFFRDITEKRLADQKITRMARTDSLTGLANRAAFLERLTLEFARARRGGTKFALHYLDLDHFKDVNDSLGHPVGDRLLDAVAKRLAACVRNTDLVARFGGDEFAVLQDNVDDLAVVERLAAKIGETIGAPYDIGGNRVSTTVSIGVVPYRSDIANIDSMMMKADLALYRAKSDGRNRYRVHVDALDEETRERLAIAEDLRHALERHEFELYYQPQVDMASGAVVGMEALLRWNHPRRGQLRPEFFIPIAETNGSIIAIGDWVIGEACRQIARWREAGIMPPLMAINLSAAQFKLADHLDRIVADHLDCHDVPSDSLELELTESVLLETTQRHREVLNRLRRSGVRLAIDDFGTGYSSLDYLRVFHVSRLKIDRRFIDDVPSDADDSAIVKAAIGLAHALGIEVVAEGVETPAQRDFLLKAGCRLAQGFLFGRPMPAAAATARLRQQRQVAEA